MSGGGFLTISISAHILGLNEQGKLAYVLTAYMVAVLMNVAALFYAAPNMASNAANAKIYQKFLELGQFALALSISSLAAGILWVIGARIGWEITWFDVALIWLFLFTQQLADYTRRASYIFQSARQALIASAVTYGSRIIALLLIRPSSVDAVLIICIVASTVSAGMMIFSHIRSSKADYGGLGNLAKSHMQLSSWAIMRALLGWACFFLPVFILGFYSSAETAGILVSIRSIGSAANVLLELLETVVPVWLVAVATRHGGEKLESSTSMLLIIGMCLWMVGLILMMVFGKWGVRLILGQNFVPYVPILIVTWIANGVHYISRIEGLKWRAKNNPKVEFFGAVGGFLALCVSLPLISNYGLLGTAWTFVIVSMGILVGQHIFLKRVNRYE